MNKHLVFLAVAGLCLGTSAAFAGSEPYAGVRVGLAHLTESDLTNSSTPGLVVTTELNTGFTVAGFAGMELAQNYRLEGELSYQRNEIDKLTFLGISLDGSGTFSAINLMGNAYYDFKTNSPITPFIGAGLGYARIQVNDFNIAGFGLPDASDGAFAWQVMAGIGYAMTKEITLELAYRYFSAMNVVLDDDDTEYNSHNFTVGIRTKF